MQEMHVELWGIQTCTQGCVSKHTLIETGILCIDAHFVFFNLVRLVATRVLIKQSNRVTEAFCFLIGSHGWQSRVAITQKFCAYFFASSKWQRYSYAMCSFLFSSIKSASICLWSARKERSEKMELNIGSCRTVAAVRTQLCVSCAPFLLPLSLENLLPNYVFPSHFLVQLPCHTDSGPHPLCPTPANSNSSLHTC